MRLAAIALLLAAGSSCVTQTLHSHGEDEGPIPQIEPGDHADDVLAVLGPPKNKERGWWRNVGTDFDLEFTVWYYKGTGRVIFDPKGHVFDSEGDPDEDGRP